MGKFNLDDRKLEIGLAREDFFVGLDESGREIFATESFEHTDFKAKSTANRKRTTVELNKNNLSIWDNNFRTSNLGKFKLQKSSGSASACKDTKQDKALALEDRGKNSELTKAEWEGAQLVLNACKKEFERFSGQLKVMLKDIGCSDPRDHLFLKVILTLAYLILACNCLYNESDNSHKMDIFTCQY